MGITILEFIYKKRKIENYFREDPIGFFNIVVRKKSKELGFKKLIKIEGNL